MTADSPGSPDIRPPRTLEGLLRQCLPPGDVGLSIIGDLRQDFAQLVRTRSASHARRWYGAQLLSLAPRYLVAKLRRNRRSPRRFPRRASLVATAMDSGFRDLRHAVRNLAGKPAFTATVIAIAALGIGATTTIFSVVDNVLLRGLPYPAAEELVFFDNPSHPVPLYRDWRDRTNSFASIAAAADDNYDLTGDGSPESVHGAQITRDFFQMLGARPLHGRLLAGEDFVGAPPRVAVLSHGIWQRRWGGDPGIIGASVVLDGFPIEVAGVLEQDFRIPEAITGAAIDLWLPLDVAAENLQNRNHYILSVVARLKRGITRQSAQADVDALAAILAEEYPRTNRDRDGSPRMYSVVSLLEATVGDVEQPLFLLLGAVGLMLLIACANLANLFLARGTDRAREMALRAALGGGRVRIGSQLIAESVVVAVAAGAIGAFLAVIGVQAFAMYNPGGIPHVDSVTIDLRVLGFTFLVSILTGVLFGLSPAVMASRSDVKAVLSEAGAGSTHAKQTAKLRGTLVVAEIALAAVLLAGAGLLFHSFLRLRYVESGFSPQNVIAMPLELPERYTEAQRLDFARDLMIEIAAIPGVEAAAAGSTIPPTTGYRCCHIEGVYPEEELEDPPYPVVHPITPQYFDVLGARMISGRTFTDADNFPTAAPAILSETTARFLFGDADPIGEKIRFGDTIWTVVGVVNDIRHWGMRRDIGHNVYVPNAIFGGSFRRFQVGVKARADVASLAPLLRQAVWRIDPLLPVPEISPLDENVSRSVAEPRFYSFLVAAFASLAILLAAAGIYGSMLYSIGQRRKELGIRLALGARTGSVVAMILRQGLVLTLIGIGLGIGGALAVTRLLRSALFGITPTDPVTFVSVTVLLCVVAMAACYVPARKASEADPIEALRAE